MDDVYGNASVSCSYVTLRIGGEQSSVTPSASDYNIYGPITSGISYVDVTNKGILAEDGAYTRECSVTIQNTGTGAKTIYEWGLFGGIYYANGNRISVAEFLLYRGTLDTPVTLQQYETITITFTRRMQINV